MVTRSKTVKLVRAKLPANAGNFTCSSHAKRPHAQFTCVTCSLPVKTGEFTGVYTASTSRKIHANCLQSHVILPDYGYLIWLITHILQVILYVELIQIFPRLAFKVGCFCKQKYMQFAGKNTKSQVRIHAKRGQKDPHNRRQRYQQLHRKTPTIAGNLLSHSRLIHLQIAGKLACILQVKLPATCVFYDVLSCVFRVRCLQCRSR